MANNLVPVADNTKTLGTDALRWQKTYTVALDNGDVAVNVGDLLTAATAPVTSVNSETGAVSLSAADVGAIATTLKGAVNGVAELDSGGKVPTAQLPDSLVGAVNYQGVWNATTNSPAITSSVGIKGYYYKVSVAGTTSIDSIAVWDVGDWIVFNGTTWDKLDNTELVSSVAGRTGAIVIAQADIGGLTTADKPVFAGIALGSLATAQTNTIAYLNESFVTNSAQRSGVRNNVLLAPTADGTAEAFGFQSTPRTTTGNGYDIKRLVSYLGTLIHDGTGDITTGMHAFSHNPTITGTTSAGTVAEFAGFYSPAVAIGSGSTVAFTNVYGIKLDRQTLGAANYQLYSAGGTSLLLSGGAAITPLKLKGYAAQSAAMLEILSSADAVLWAVDAAGVVTAAGYKSAAGNAGGSTTTGGLTFENGLYISGTITGGGTGDVVGPASATDGVMALFDGTTGKLIKAGAAPPSVPVKASGAELDTGTDDAKFATAKAIADSHNVPSVAPGTSGNVLTSNGTDWTSAAPAGGGSGSTKTPFVWRAGSLDFDYATTPSLDRLDSTNVRWQRLRYDDTTEEFANGGVLAPSNLDTAGTVTFTVTGCAVTPAASKNVQMKIYHGAHSHGEDGDAAFASKVSGDKALSATAEYIDVLTWTETVANLGWAAGDWIDFKLSRIAASADGLTGDYGVYAFGIEFPVSG